MNQIYQYIEGQRQAYEKYTEQDQKVWKLLYNQQMPRVFKSASREFIRGLQSMQFTDHEIPHFDTINQILRNYTRWQVVVVPGLIDDKTFFELLAERKFPASTWLRDYHDLDYLEQPDMFHDVFGHVPLLTIQAYVDFLQSLSMIALEHIDHPQAIEYLSRIYWFTVEFGLIEEHGKLKIYGAGILSSRGETEYSVSPAAQTYPYDVEQIMRTSFKKDEFQAQYWVIDNYEQLFDSIPDIRGALSEFLRKEKRKTDDQISVN